MRKTSRLLLAFTACLLVAGLAAVFMARTGRGGRHSTELDALESAQTPLGGLFDRMSSVSKLKEQMGELRAVWPAMEKFSSEHQGNLPMNLGELRPYLPANLANMQDERWEMPSGGMAAGPLMQRNDIVLLQQKNVPPHQSKIVVYGDGHIEYKR